MSNENQIKVLSKQCPLDTCKNEVYRFFNAKIYLLFINNKHIISAKVKSNKKYVGIQHEITKTTIL